MNRLTHFIAVLAIFFGTISTAQASATDVFNHYDVDGNGRLTKTELGILGATVSANFGKSITAPGVDIWADLNEDGFVNFRDYAIVDIFKNMSVQNMLDKNTDGKVSLSEVLVGLSAVQTSFGKSVESDGYDPLADFDATDFINYADYGAVQKFVNKDPELLQKYNGFVRLDADHNGKVTYDEAMSVAKVIAEEFGTASVNPIADLNGNGYVNYADFSFLANIVREVSPDVYDQLVSQTEALASTLVEQPISKVDLVADEKISITRNTSGRVNQLMSFRSRIQNIGSEKSVASRAKLTIESVNGEVLASELVDIPSLRQNSSRYVTINWIPKVKGQYIVKVIADYDQSVNEKNEGNNVVEHSFRVR